LCVHNSSLKKGEEFSSFLSKELNDWEREWLYWYDRNGVRYPTANERAAMAEVIAYQERLTADRANLEKQLAEQAQQEAEAIAEQERKEKLQERQEKERLAVYLRSLGINPNDIP
jgi:hypothetical protein